MSTVNLAKLVDDAVPHAMPHTTRAHVMVARGEILDAGEVSLIGACGGHEAVEEFAPKAIGFMVKGRGLIMHMDEGVAIAVALLDRVTYFCGPGVDSACRTIKRQCRRAFKNSTTSEPVRNCCGTSVGKHHMIRKQLARKLDHHTPMLSAVRGVEELMTLSRIPTESTGMKMIFVMEAA